MPRIMHHISRHALDTIKRRGVTPEAIAEVLAFPCTTEPHGKHTRLVGRNGLVLVLSDDGTLVSVLLRSSVVSGEQWTDETCRAPWSA